MTARYFAFNTLAAATRSAATVVDGDTTAGRFDSAYVSSCIKLTASVDYLELGAPFADGSSTISGTLWTRFDTYHAGGFSSGNTLALWLNAGANAYRIQTTAGSILQMQYWNSGTSAWVNWGSTFTLGVATLYTFAIKLAINSAFEIYVGGTLVANSATVPTNGATAVTTLRLTYAGSSGLGYFSQIMGADFDIRDSHLYSRLPTANGTYTDGTGSATDVGESVLDDGTAIGLPAVGNKHTFTKAAIPTMPAGLTIAALGVNIRGRVGGGTVSDGKAKIRSNTTDAASGSKSFTSGYGPRGHFFTTDPDTGTTWTKTGFDAAEVGIEAA